MEGGPGALPPEVGRIESRRRVFVAISADRYPRSAAVAVTMAAYVSTDQYVWGLRRVLDGSAAARPGRHP